MLLSADAAPTVYDTIFHFADGKFHKLCVVDFELNATVYNNPSGKAMS